MHGIAIETRIKPLRGPFCEVSGEKMQINRGRAIPDISIAIQRKQKMFCDRKACGDFDSRNVSLEEA
jgi:hypothetical protein